MNPAAPVTSTFMLQPPIALAFREKPFDVECHRPRLTERPNGAGAELYKFLVCYGDNDCFVGAGLGPRLEKLQAIFVAGLCGIGPGVEDIDLGVALLKSRDHVNNLGVAKIGAVFFEGEPHDQHAASYNWKAAFHHKTGHTIRNVGAHAIVNTPPSQNDLWVVSNLL